MVGNVGPPCKLAVYLYLPVQENRTVVPTKSDSDVILCLQLLS